MPDERPGDVLLAAGAVAFGPGARPFAGARAVVRVEDVARAGARALPLGEQVLAGLAWDGDPAAAVPFAVFGPAPPPAARPAVRVHVDLDGDGRVSAGDLVSTEYVAAGPGVRVTVHPVP